MRGKIITSEIIYKFREYYFEGNKNECWKWGGCFDCDGYGRFSYKQLDYKAHRVSLLWHLKLSESELDVLHTCDNR
jgi:hypothetical protein